MPINNRSLRSLITGMISDEREHNHRKEIEELKKKKRNQ